MYRNLAPLLGWLQVWLCENGVFGVCIGGRSVFGCKIGRLARFLLSEGSRNVCMENLAMAGDMNILDYLEAGIRAEGVRQQTIANNVANMATPGFRRSDVRFEELLAKAMKAGGDVDKSKLEAEVFQPKNTPVKANGNDVSMDMEVGEMVKNSLKHKTFTLLLKKKYRQMSDAMAVK